VCVVFVDKESGKEFQRHERKTRSMSEARRLRAQALTVVSARYAIELIPTEIFSSSSSSSSSVG
jgi:hypothetical protein